MTAAANALEHGADLAEVQEMLGPANIDSRRNRVRCSRYATDPFFFMKVLCYSTSQSFFF